MNTHKSLYGCMFSFLLNKIPKPETAGSYDKGMLNFLRNHQTFFKWIVLFYIPPGIQEGSSFSTFSLIITLITVFLTVEILVNIKWYIIVVLISMSLIYYFILTMHLDFWITFLRNVLKDRNMLFNSLAGNKISLFEGTFDFFFNSLTRNLLILTSCTIYNVWSELLFFPVLLRYNGHTALYPFSV